MLGNVTSRKIIEKYPGSGERHRERDGVAFAGIEVCSFGWDRLMWVERYVVERQKLWGLWSSGFVNQLAPDHRRYDDLGKECVEERKVTNANERDDR
jgi:hypothetical protein